MSASLTHRCFSPAARRRLLPLSAVLYVSLLMTASASFSQVPVRKNVLIINEVGITYPASGLVTQQLMSSLASGSIYQTEFHLESLDSTYFADEASQRKVEDLLFQKYRDRNLDVIVAMGPAPIRFLSRFSSTFLPDVPVVLCGSTQEQVGNPDLDSRFTGSWMQLEPAKTLDVALKMSPTTKHVVVVGGSSAFDRGVLAITRARLDKYPVALDFNYLVDLEMSSLLERLRHLPPKTVVLYVSFFRDATGSPFANATTALPLVSEAANAPVFGMSDTYLGHGVVGGNVMSFAEQGKIAARIVSEIFQGRRAQDIPIERGSDFYMFDWTQLRRWGLSENTLPAGSVVLYRERTLWERAKWILITALLMILGLTALTVYLLVKDKQLRLARTEQMRLSGMLIHAQEDERSRLASELHDDFSQRLAVLSLGLETAAEIIPESPEEANRQLHELLNSASEIGADLHTVSHRLHSYTLERLGLVAGVGAFCKEFTAQQGIQVAFSYENVPRSVPPEVALCLFRVVQEALRNVKKHSGASQAEVRLEMFGHRIHLSITDNGNGFNFRETSHGLGIWSMQERLRLVGGRFEIHSRAQRGTQIEAWARAEPNNGHETPYAEEVRRDAGGSN